MKAKPRWMQSVIATAQLALPPLPFTRTAKTNAAAEPAPKAAQA